MAYNRRYNPDALPAHAEPEQAAQLVGRSSSTRDSAVPSRSDSYATRPPPPTPIQTARQDDRRQDDRRQDDRRQDDRRQDDRRQDDRRQDDRRQDDRRQDDRRQDDRYGRGYSSPRTESNYDYDRRQPMSPRTNSQGYDDGRSQRESYGSDPRRYDPQQQAGYGGVSSQQPPPASRPRETPAPPRNPNDRDALWPMFRAVDKDRTGQLSERELGAALVNGDYTQFDPHTVRMMIRMFDVDRSGTISFDEFCGLWGFLADWRKLFDRFDEDHSGNISLDEFGAALIAFGYRLSNEYVSRLFSTYDIRNRGALSFDLFVQSCISLKRMTDVFKRYDTDRDGYITLSFEEFLSVVLAQK